MWHEFLSVEIEREFARLSGNVSERLEEACWRAHWRKLAELKEFGRWYIRSYGRRKKLAQDRARYQIRKTVTIAVRACTSCGTLFNVNAGSPNQRICTRACAYDGRSSATRFTIDGQTKTLKAWCQHYGVSYQMVWMRMNRGVPLLRALKPPTRQRRNEDYTFGSVTKTLSEWCADYGISFQTFWYRKKRGWDIKRALETPAVSRGRAA